MEKAASAAFSVSRFSRKNARDETIACAVTWPTSKPECRAPRFTCQAGRKSRQVHRFSGRCPRSPHNRMALWGRKVSSNRDSAFRNQAYSRDQDAGSSLGKLKSEPAMRSARRSKLAPPKHCRGFRRERGCRSLPACHRGKAHLVRFEGGRFTDLPPPRQRETR